MKKLKRVTIIGAPGTGKTVLSLKLKEIFDIPVCHIDSIHQLPDWKLRPTEERDRMIIEEANKDEWILDGTFLDTLDYRIKRADLTIYLDFNSFSALKGVLTRIAKNHGKEKPDMPGCKEKFDLSFIAYVCRYNFERRKLIYGILNQNPDSDIRIVKYRKDLDSFIEELKKDFLE